MAYGMATETARSTSESGVAADFHHSTALPDQVHLKSRDDRQPAMSARDRLDMGRRRRRHGNMFRAQTGRTRDCQSPLACRVDSVLPRSLPEDFEKPRQINYPRLDIGGQGGEPLAWWLGLG